MKIHIDYMNDKILAKNKTQDIEIPVDKWRDLALLIGVKNEQLNQMSDLSDTTIIGKIFPKKVFQHRLLTYLQFQIPKSRLTINTEQLEGLLHNNPPQPTRKHKM